MRTRCIWRWRRFFVSWHSRQLGLGFILNLPEGRHVHAPGVGFGIGPFTIGALFTDKEVEP